MTGADGTALGGGALGSGRLGGEPPTSLVTPRYLGQRERRRSSSLLWRLSVPVAIIAVWQLASWTGRLDPQILAAPVSVAETAVELARSGQLVEFLLASGRRAGLGVSIGLAIGLVLGVVSGISARGDELVDPTMQMFRAVPFLALVPLFLAWFGVGELFKVVLIAVATIAPMYAYTYVGVRGVDRRLVESARGFGLEGLALVRSVVLPTALPSILMGVRIALSVSLTGLIAAEQIGTTAGIGYLVSLSQQYFRTDYMVLCIAIYAVLGLVIDAVVRGVERVAMPWRAGVGAR